MTFRSWVAPVIWLTVPAPLVGQERAEPDSGQVAPTIAARSGSQFTIPLASLIVPGIGQYVSGAPLAGAAFTATAVAGLAAGWGADADVVTDLPRGPSNQRAYVGLQTVFTAGALSAWDVFHRAIPALQAEGKYRFLPNQRETVGDLFTAPFDLRFLKRWTTWVDLAWTGAITALVLSNREEGVAYEPYRARDAAFAGVVSFNAGVGEEALFRGWLLPLLYQTTGNRFWLANTIQSGLFGAGHVGQAGPFALAIAGWAVYEGWLTRHNDWSIRESVFHHFWYDVMVVTATFLSDEQEVVQLRFPTISF